MTPPPLRFTRVRTVGALLVAAGLLAGLASSALAQDVGQNPATGQDRAGGPIVDILEVEGMVDRSVAGYLRDAVRKAEADGTSVVVIQLDSPGTRGIDAEALVDDLTGSSVPVAVWAGPPGARVGEGAALLYDRAAVKVVAPGAVIGPVSGTDLADRTGAPPTGPVFAVLPEGTTALPDGVDLPPGITPQDLTIVGEREVAGEGVAAFAAATLPDVLRGLDGLEIEHGGATEVLDVDPVAANVRFSNMGLGRRILHTVANPALAYLLVVAGMMAMLFELYQPGFGVAGLAGLAVFALGGYGLWVLPTSWAALAALLAGMVLLALDLSLGRLGVLTALGTAGMTAGSVWLYPGPAPLAISGWLIAFVVVANLAYFVGVLTTVLRAQGNQALAGAERLVGSEGVVRSMLNPEGHVFIDGALWRARAPEEAGKVKTGTQVRVVGLDDRLTLEVELVASEQPAR